MEKQKYNTVIIVEYAWQGGHIPTYHKHICKALLELGYIVYSISPNPEEVESWLSERMMLIDGRFFVAPWDKNAQIINGVPSQPTTTAETVQSGPSEKKQNIKAGIIKAILNIPFLKRLFQVHEYWKAAQQRVEALIPDCQIRKDIFVLFPYLDLHLLTPYYGGSLFKRAFTLKWGGVFFHPTFLRKRSINSSSQFNIFRTNTCKSIAILDEGCLTQFQAAIKKPVVLFPDITNEEIDSTNPSALAVEIVRKADGRKIISLIGIINEKKNVHTLIQAIKESKELGHPYFFLIAGPNNQNSWQTTAEFEEIQNAITKYTDNSFWHLDSIKDGHDYNSLIAISDIILASYKNFYHSSNTLTKSSLFKKPSIVSKGYLMEERVVKYQIGIAINENNPGMLLQAIAALLDGANLKGNKLDSQYSTYYQQHSYNRLKFALTEMLA